MKSNNQTVLIGVLNWGLGHATRSMPIIEAFLRKNYNVHIASDGDALHFLKKEYPQLYFHQLPGYNVNYPYKSIILNIIRSSFSIIKAIINEYSATKKIVKKINPGLIVSDNRYGVRHKNIKSILISHQIQLQLGNVFLSKTGTLFSRRLITKFDELWIPDFNDTRKLAGKLSVAPKSIKHKYIGPVTRFKYNKLKKKYDIAIILSGPEPQRTKFEELVSKHVLKIDKKVIIVLGKIFERKEYYLCKDVLVKSYALSDELNRIINESEMVISRSGYSTVMDLAVLGTKAIFVPTPGQTEQEYIAKYLKSKGLYYFQEQDEFNLEKALIESKTYSGLKMEIDLLKDAIDDCL